MICAGVAGASASLGSGSAQMTPGGIGMQPPNSAVAEQVHFFHNVILMPVITVISLFVLALLMWIVFRYNSKANPVPSKFSHNTLIEVIWTAVPIIILLGIALPSFDLLYKEDVIPDGKQVVVQGDGQSSEFVFANDFTERRVVSRKDHLQVLKETGGALASLKYKKDYTVSGFGEAEIVVSLNSAPAAGERVIIRGGRSTEDVSECGGFRKLVGECPQNIVLAPTITLKANGYQWGWLYSYPDFGDFEFASNMLPKDLASPDVYLREVDNRIVVPVGETVRVITTAKDVIHSWALPAFAVKVDAVPGRLNETWFKADRVGVYYGQCSEICGIKHAFMPIAVKVVSRSAFETWVDGQRALASMDPMFGTNPVKVADAGAVAK